ncbi:MAG: multicopper oxidase domain-containing protein [Akkermansiaceae bacterium]|nr:multicopper oxidase domain-containing protein [Akkermansiaceae bacterium]
MSSLSAAEIRVAETCDGSVSTVADSFTDGNEIARQIPMKALNDLGGGAIGPELPEGWTGRFAIGGGPCGIAKEWGPSHPHRGEPGSGETDMAEFLDDDDPQEAQRLLSLVKEFGQHPENGGARKPVEYYQMGISVGEGHILTDKQRQKITGDMKTPTAFLGYHGWKEAPQTPGPMFQARLGRPMVVRFINRVQDYMSVHLHGMHGPAHSDGHPAFVIPKEYEHSAKDGELGYGSNFRDYFYPHTVPAKQGMERKEGEGVPGSQKDTDHLDYSESPSTMWYHDHSMDVTGPHAYLGLAGFCPIFDDMELRFLGNGVLPFCPGKGKVYQNLKGAHDKDAGDGTDAAALDEIFEAQRGNFLDLCMVFNDKCLSVKGKTPGVDGNQLLYSAKGHNGHLGNVVLANGNLTPHSYVLPRKLRLRMLNGSNARIYKMALFLRLEGRDGKYRSSPIDGKDPDTRRYGSGNAGLIRLGKVMPKEKPEWFRIGADSWLYPRPVAQRNVLLAMANRADMIVDFGAIQDWVKSKLGGKIPADRQVAVYLCNLLDQENGRGPKVKLDEAQGREPAQGLGGAIGVPMVSEVERDSDGAKGELSQPWPVMKFIITENLEKVSLPKGLTLSGMGYTALAEIPDASVALGSAQGPGEGGAILRPHRGHDSHVPVPGKPPRVRDVLFHRGGGIWKVNDRIIDEFRSNFVPKLDAGEYWVLENGGGGWWHPIHIHLESHQLLEYLEESGIDEARDTFGKVIGQYRNQLPADADARRQLEAILSDLESGLREMRENPEDGKNDNPSPQMGYTRERVRALDAFIRLQTLTSGGGMIRPLDEVVKQFDAGLRVEDFRLWRDIEVPEWYRYKSDTTVLGPRTRAKVFMHFRTFDGPFVFHCHNLEHEDMRMMLVVDPRAKPVSSVQPPTGNGDRHSNDDVPVIYRHPWRFTRNGNTEGPDYDKRPHADRLEGGQVGKTPAWDQPPPGKDETPRAHPIWGGWDQHL